MAIASTLNRELLDSLLKTGHVPIRRGPLLDQRPTPTRVEEFARIEGMLLGLAIGDALGNTSEGLTRGSRHARYGEIRDFLPNRHAGGRCVGLPSDDTQLAFWTVEQVLLDDAYIPEHVAERFASQPIFGSGTTVRQFVHNFRMGDRAWFECGIASAGNGALMRIPAAIVPHAARSTSDLWVDTILNTMTTHNDTAAIISSVAYVSMLWTLLSTDRIPAREWWLHSFLEAARAFETDSHYSMRGGQYASFRGKFTDFVEMAVREADRLGLPANAACDRWYSGAYLPETICSALYILMCHADDPEEALVRAVNDTKDNDTIAAIVGAAVGALHGARALPERWRGALLGRTAADDDGKVFELIERIRLRWFA